MFPGITQARSLESYSRFGFRRLGVGRLALTSEVEFSVGSRSCVRPQRTSWVGHLGSEAALRPHGPCAEANSPLTTPIPAHRPPCATVRQAVDWHFEKK